MALIETITDASGQTTYVNGVARIAATSTGVTLSGVVSGAGGYATGVRQVVYATTGTQASGASTIPFDNTIPQITEGWEVLTCTITPQSATSTLYVTAIVNCSSSYASQNSVAVAIFRDSTANALGSNSTINPIQNALIILPIQVSSASGSTSATTFRMRIGANIGSTYTNGQSAIGQLFGGVAATSIMVMEVGA